MESKGLTALKSNISAYIGSMPFLWLDVFDIPGKVSDRSYIEANSIALLSNFGEINPIDPSSKSWLGHYSRNQKVQRSGLWNDQHVEQVCDARFLEKMRTYIERV